MENENFGNSQNKPASVPREWYEDWQCPEVPAQQNREPVQQPVEPEPKKKKEKKNIPWLYAVLTLALVLVCCLVTGLVMNGIWQDRMEAQARSFYNRMDVLQSEVDALYHTGGAAAGTATQEGYLTPGQVYANNMKAVVAVAGNVVEAGFYGYNEYESFGSGFIISEDGYVVSNYHVVEGTQSLTVITYDDQEYEAQLIGYDATNDIALLKIEAQALPCVTIGSSDALAVGDQVAAVGNPLGELTSTLTVGYVSAKDRIVATDGTAINMIQTDAAINSGNSGGPLFNMKGEVVGITTAKYSGTSSSGASIEGIGFAIPIDDVYSMLEDLRNYGYVTGAYLGVMVRDVDEYGQSYGLPAGVYVEEVTPGYAAEKAGIAVGDIIVELGGYKVTCMTELSRALRKFRPGDTTSVTVYRNGQEQYLSVVLDEKPQEEAPQPQPEEPAAVMPGEEGIDDWYNEFFRHFFGG
ncbi:MAG: trypsin-like peptidase domain-containing protein [Oscillospiraceae bacterium]|nr:trypsin-like peptidase domain-containing protein [Oscillospiraceae bacterium]